MNIKFFAVFWLSVLSQVLVVSFNVGTMGVIKPMFYEIKVGSADEYSRMLASRMINALSSSPLGLYGLLILCISIAVLSFLLSNFMLEKRWQKNALVGTNLLFIAINVLSPILT